MHWDIYKYIVSYTDFIVPLVWLTFACLWVTRRAGRAKVSGWEEASCSVGRFHSGWGLWQTWGLTGIRKTIPSSVPAVWPDALGTLTAARAVWPKTMSTRKIISATMITDSACHIWIEPVGYALGTRRAVTPLRQMSCPAGPLPWGFVRLPWRDRDTFWPGNEGSES